MSSIRFSVTTPTLLLSLRSARCEAASAPDPWAIAQSSKEPLQDLGAHVQAIVTRIRNLQPDENPSAYGLAARQVDDLILGIKNSDVSMSKRKGWRDELCAELKHQIAAQNKLKPPSVDSQARIHFLDRMLSNVESLLAPLQQQQQPQPPQPQPQQQEQQLDPRKGMLASTT